MDKEKEKFIYSTLMPYYLDLLGSNDVDDSTYDEFAELSIFPYRTNDGTKYGSLAGENIFWYYTNEKSKNELSKQSYCILDEKAFKEAKAENLYKHLKEKLSDKYLYPFTKDAVISDILDRMEKETALSDEWWSCAIEIFPLWDKQDPGAKFKKAFSNIQTPEILLADDYCDISYQKVLFELRIFNDVRSSEGYKAYCKKIGLDNITYAEDLLRYLGVPSSFSDGCGTVLSGVENLFKMAETKIRYPVCESDVRAYRIADLASYIYFECLSKDCNAADSCGRKYAGCIAVKNATGAFVPIKYDLFYASSIPEESITYFGRHYDALLVNDDYRYKRLKKLHSIEDISAFENYQLCGVSSMNAYAFYRWAWNYTHSKQLVSLILPTLRSVNSDQAEFAIAVLSKANELDALEGAEVNLQAESGLILANALTLNQIQNRDDCKITVMVSDSCELINTQEVRDIIIKKVAVQNTIDANTEDAIKHAAFWDHVYMANEKATARLSMEVMYAVFCDKQKKTFTNGLLLPRVADEDCRILAIAKYIEEKYNCTIPDIAVDWGKEYDKITAEIKKFIMKPAEICTGRNYADDDDKADLADVKTFGDEQKLWDQLKREYDIVHNGKKVDLIYHKAYLNVRYHGHCQICGSQTPHGINPYYYTFRMVKKHENELADMIPNLFCLCPSCHGNLQYSFLMRDLSDIYDKASKYVSLYREFCDEGYDETGNSAIAEFEAHIASNGYKRTNVKKPIICNVVVNGESHEMDFSWEHFIRIAYVLMLK